MLKYNKYIGQVFSQFTQTQIDNMSPKIGSALINSTTGDLQYYDGASWIVLNVDSSPISGWLGTVTYALKEMVTYDGEIYRSKAGGNVNRIPSPTVETYWELISDNHINISEDGTSKTADLTGLNFTGSGVNVTDDGAGNVTVDVGGGGTSTTPVVIVPASESTITPVSASNSGDFRPYIGQVTVLNIVYSGTTGIVNLTVNDSSDCIVGDIIKMDRADNVANDGKFVIVEVTDTTHIVINNIAITDDSNNEYHANVFEGIQGKVLSKMIFNGCEYPYGIDGGRFNPDTPVDFSRYFTAKVPTESVGGTTFSLSVEYMTGTYHDETASTAGVYFKARAYTVKPGIIATLKGRTMGTYCSDQGTVLDIPLSPNTFFTEQSGLTVTVGDPYIAGDHLIIEVTRASTNAGDTLDNSIMVTSITVSCT